MSLQGIIGTLLPFAGAIPGSIVTRKNIKGWYESLERPTWRPPNWAFGPVWTSLYAGMGYASYLIYQDGADLTALGLYASQLILNWAWTPIFFGSHNVKLAFYEIAALWLNVAACGIKFYTINKTAGLLFAPYLAWVSLASALTYSIWSKNGDKPEGKKEWKIDNSSLLPIKQL